MEIETLKERRLSAVKGGNDEKNNANEEKTSKKEKKERNEAEKLTLRAVNVIQ